MQITTYGKMMKKVREARFTSAKRMPEPTVQVVLKHDRYYPGGQLSGVVQIDLSSPVMATSLDVKLSGLQTSFIGGLFGARANPETRYANYYTQYVLLVGKPRKSVEQDVRHSLTSGLMSRNGSVLTSETTLHQRLGAAGQAGNADDHEVYSCAASNVMYADGEASHTMTRPPTAAGGSEAAMSFTTESAPTHLIAGTYSYPFEVTLPCTLPPSFKISKSHDACSKIVYTATATLVLRSGKQYTKEKTFTVMSLPVPLQRWLALHPENTNTTSLGSGNRLNSMTSQMLHNNDEMTLATVASTLTNATQATLREDGNDEYTVCARRMIDHTRAYTADTIAREEALLLRRQSVMHNNTNVNATGANAEAARNAAQERPLHISPLTTPPTPTPTPAVMQDTPARTQPTPPPPQQQNAAEAPQNAPETHNALPLLQHAEQNSYSMAEGAEDEVRAFNSPENENPIAAQVKSPHRHRHRHRRNNNKDNAAATQKDAASAQDAARVLNGRTGTFLQEAVPEAPASTTAATEEDLTAAHNNNNNDGEETDHTNGNGTRRRFGDLRGRLHGRFLRSESSSSSSSNSSDDEEESSRNGSHSNGHENGSLGSSALSRSGSLRQRKYNPYMKDDNENRAARANNGGDANGNGGAADDVSSEEGQRRRRRWGSDDGNGSFSVAERGSNAASLRSMQAFAENFAIPLRRGILKRGTIALRLQVDRRVVIQGNSKVQVQVILDTTHCTRSIQKIRLALIARGVIKSRMEEFEINRTCVEHSLGEKVSKGAVAQLRPVELRVPHSTPLSIFTEGYTNRVFLSVQLTIDGTLHNFVRSAEVELLVVRGVNISGQSRRLLYWTNYFIGKDVSRSAITAPTVDARLENTLNNSTTNTMNNAGAGSTTTTGELRKMTFVPLDAQYNGPPAFTDPLVGLNPFSGAGAAVAAAASGEDNALPAAAIQRNNNNNNTSHDEVVGSN